LAVANYHDTNGHYPPAYLVGPDGRPWHSWRVLILPYIEGDDILRQYRFDEPWDGPNNRLLADRMPSTYALHGDRKSGTTTTNYLAVVGPKTVWQPGRLLGPLPVWRPDRPIAQRDITDGSDSTLLIAENRGLNVHWMEPRDLDFDTMDWTVNSPKGISSKYDRPAVLMANYSVVRVSPGLSPATLRAMATVAGGELVSGGGDGTWDVIPDGRDRPVTDP
jgi:hypothetical protein